MNVGKKIFVFCVLLFFGVGDVLAGQAIWTNGVANNLWQDPNNWHGKAVPVYYDQVLVNGASPNGAMINSGITAETYDLWLGSGPDLTTPAKGELTIAGGTLNVGSGFNIGYHDIDTGIVNLVAGDVNTYSWVKVGVSGNGTLNIQNGRFRSGGWLILGYQETGVGHVQLDGGMLDTNGRFLLSSGSSIDITKGVWRLFGDQTVAVGALVAVGQITAYGGYGDISAVHESDPCNTIVTATPWYSSPVCQNGFYLSGDLDNNCYVDLGDVAMLIKDWL
ncbi:MAG: hypothetical protein ABFD79_07505, partial [Phycisphaerales bacterium]